MIINPLSIPKSHSSLSQHLVAMSPLKAKPFRIMVAAVLEGKVRRVWSPMTTRQLGSISVLVVEICTSQERNGNTLRTSKVPPLTNETLLITLDSSVALKMREGI